MDADDFRREKINRLSEHSRFRFDSTDPPADDAEAVNHRGVRIGADECVGEENAIALKHAFREVFEIDLVNDADPWRHETEGFERLLAPLQELVTLAVALELHLHVQPQRFRRTGEIDLDRMIDHQIDRHERLDDLRIASKLFHCAAHRRQIDHERNAGEILENDSRDDEGDFLLRRRLRFPVRQRLYILAPYFFPVAIPQHGFEHDPNADGNRE